MQSQNLHWVKQFEVPTSVKQLRTPKNGDTITP